MQDNRILQQSLEKELALLEELNGLSLLKKDALLKDDLETLEAIVLKEEALSAKLKTISDECLPAVRFFFKAQKNLPAELAEIIAKVRKCALQFQMNNELNQDLIQDSLAVVQFTINSFRSLLDGSVTGLYGSSGRVNQKEIHLLDAKG
jgi:flagellar biosynthesis/type III secretory pathway chaperone